MNFPYFVPGQRLTLNSDLKYDNMLPGQYHRTGAGSVVDERGTVVERSQQGNPDETVIKRIWALGIQFTAVLFRATSLRWKSPGTELEPPM
jgi:hypothetical protein